MTYQLTTDKQERKRTPIYSGVLCYFPLAFAATARVSWRGNEQHNPGEPLHWARGKSTDQLDAAIRHIVEYGMGNKLDDDGEAHLAKALWRVAAQLQLDEEARLGTDSERWREGTVWQRPKEETEAYLARLHYDAVEVDKDAWDIFRVENNEYAGKLWASAENADDAIDKFLRCRAQAEQDK